ncbi:MAG TPA: RNA methyltransferase [Acidimicrobiales bacterium]|nr:RNA methyltransferase [Acidimicrobiales bacterium]
MTRALRSANAEFQVLRALATNRQTRNRENAFIVQGVRNIDAARAHGWTVRAALTPMGASRSAWAEDIVARVDDHVELAPSLFDELAEREERPELLLVVEKGRGVLDRVALATVLDRPSSPGNIGTIIRTADALGGDAVIVVGHGADPYDPRAIRASTGSFFAVPVVEAPNADALGELGVTLVATDEHGDTSLDQLPAGPLALLFGNETTGLSRALREAADLTVAIPMAGTASSLNVAAAHAIVLHAASSRRG